MNDKPAAERFDSTTITVLISLFAVLVLSNWPFEYVGTAFRYYYSSQIPEINSSPFLFSNYEKISGGFPFTYLIREEDDPASQPQYWSTISLLLNIVFGLVIIVVAGICSSRYRRSVISLLYIGRQWAFIGCSIPLVVICAFVGARSYLKHQAIKRLEKGGLVVTYAIVPKPFVGLVPSFVLSQFAAIRSAALVNASPAIIEETSKLATMRSLIFFGRFPSPLQIESLSKRTQLKFLSLASGRIDTDLKVSIRKLEGLRQLEMISCMGLKDGFDGLQGFERLRHLGIVNCDLQLSTLPSDGWSTNIQSMHVSRQRKGADTLELHGIQSLRTLSIARMDNQVNDELLKIRLHEMPALERFNVENLQKISLDISTAPRLHAITFIDQEFGFRTSSSRSLFSSPWVESLSLHDLPSLRELHFDAIDLEKFEVQGLPNLQQLSMGRYGFLTRDETTPSDDHRPRMQSIINALGKLDGPKRLDLSSLPLKGIDLSPLAENTRIRDLVLYHCGIEGSQLQAIARIPNLINLDLRHCPIGDKDTTVLLDGKLKLDQLLVSGEQFERIEVIKQDKLQGFVTNNALLAKYIDIRESPELSSEIVLGSCVEKLCIRDARSLLGVSVDGPLPSNCELHGFRSLRFFAVGGPNATDQLCNHLWQCAEMDHLTIAYGALSRNALSKVGKLPRLTILSLPGSDTDDATVVQNWGNLQMLSDVNLSETKITAPTIDFLLNQSNLQKLSVNYCNLLKTDLERLTEVKQLIELEVAGIGLTPETLQGCLQRGMLDRLDLSDSQVSDDAVQLLCSNMAGSLRFLGLNGCGLNDRQLRRISEAHSKLVMDIGGNNASDELQAEFDSKGKLISRDDREAFRQLLTDDRGIVGIMELHNDFDAVRGRIDLQQFAVHHP